MEVSGSYEFNATSARVWELLMDPRAISRCLPGCESYEDLGNDQFRAVLSVGLGPIRGRYSATISLRDQDPPRSYLLSVAGSGSLGLANGESRVTLIDHGDTTTVRVESDAQTEGGGIGLGQRLMSGVAKTVMDRFFGCLREGL